MTTTKNLMLNVRMTLEERNLLAKAARAAGCPTTSDFVRKIALAYAAPSQKHPESSEFHLDIDTSAFQATPSAKARKGLVKTISQAIDAFISGDK